MCNITLFLISVLCLAIFIEGFFLYKIMKLNNEITDSYKEIFDLYHKKFNLIEGMINVIMSNIKHLNSEVDDCRNRFADSGNMPDSGNI